MKDPKSRLYDYKWRVTSLVLAMGAVNSVQDDTLGRYIHVEAQKDSAYYNMHLCFPYEKFHS